MNQKIDKRRHYILVVDTETTNTIQMDGKLDMSNVLMYDCGWAVIDTHGNVYETASFVNADIYLHEKELMQSAYYAKKLPQYEKQLASGERKLATTFTIRKAMMETVKRYGIKEICAHNARFDANALNVVQRWTTKSRYRYWFPYNSIEWWDSLKMARSVIGKMPTYKAFCEKNGYKTKNNQCRFTAEVLYRFITKDTSFVESHTALEDVLIEKEIVAYCYRQHKKMQKKLWERG